jgi:hypothetical protein
MASMINSGPAGGRASEAAGIKSSATLQKLAGNVEEEKKARGDPQPKKAEASKTRGAGDVVRLPNAVSISASAKDKVDLLKSPTLYLRDSSKAASGPVYCECGNVCNPGSTQCPSCLKDDEVIEYSGPLCEKNKHGQLVTYWYHLLNKQLYCKKKIT